MPDTSKMTRRERERAAHREAILQAAEEVFANKGFHAATVQEIADRAEFSVGYLYNHFKNKDALYVELVDSRFDAYMKHVEDRLNATEDSVHKIGVAIRAVMEFFVEHEQFFRIFLRVGSQTGEELMPGLPEKSLHKYYRYTERFAAMLGRGVDAGVFVQADPHLLAQCLENITHAAMHYSIMNHVPADEKMAALLERICLYGISTGKQEAEECRQ